MEKGVYPRDGHADEGASRQSGGHGRGHVGVSNDAGGHDREGALDDRGPKRCTREDSIRLDGPLHRGICRTRVSSSLGLLPPTQRYQSTAVLGATGRPREDEASGGQRQRPQPQQEQSLR